MTVWRCVEDDHVGASEGLAGDELLMSQPGPTLRLYTYRSHCALVGKFQNLEAEVDVGFCRERGIAVGRRPTGGGAILMGENQLGIAVVNSSRSTGVPEHPKEIFRVFGGAILRGLERLGIRGSLEAKNDIRVNDRKIAGLGVCREENGVFLFHTSLIVDLDLDLMLRVLKIPAEKLTDKLRARVEDNLTTVRRELGAIVPVADVRAALRAGFVDYLGLVLAPRPFDLGERAEIAELARTKYEDNTWIERRVPTPDANGSSLRKTPYGLLRLYVSLAGDRIKDLTITGDFVGEMDGVLALETSLAGAPADPGALRGVVTARSAEVARALGGVNADDLAGAILEAVLEARKTSSAGGSYGCFVDTREGRHA